MVNLKNYTLGEIQKGVGSGVYIVRAEKDLPTHYKGLCEEVLLKETDKVKFYSIATEQRILGYVFKFKEEPRIVHTWNYLYLYYGTKPSSKIKIEYQDSNIRLTRSGNGGFIGLVLRSKTKAEEPTLLGEPEDD